MKLRRLPKVHIVIPVPEDCGMSPISSASSPAPLSPEPEVSPVKIQVDDDPKNKPTYLPTLMEKVRELQKSVSSPLKSHLNIRDSSESGQCRRTLKF